MPAISQTDVRYVRTEQVITEAFIALILESGYYTITVRDICSRAGVSRGTFYQHYADKAALLASFEERIKTGLLEALMPGKIPFETAAVKERVVRLFTYCEDNISVMRALFGRNGDFAFQKRMRDMLWEQVFSQHVNYDGLAGILGIPPEYLRECVNSSHYRIAQAWIEKEVRESPEEMADIYLKLSVISPVNKARVSAEKRKVPLSSE